MFLCALFSKVMAITLPLVMVLYDYVFLEGSCKAPAKKFFPPQITVKDKMIFFVLAAVFAAIGAAAAVPSFDGNFIASLFKNIYRAVFQYAFYIVKFFLPFKLSIVYPPAMESKTLFTILLPFFVLFWSWINIAAFKKSKKIFFGLMFYTITILPVLNIVPFGLEIPADRFTYIPYIGLFYCAANGISLINSKKSKAAAAAALCCIIVFFCFLSRERVNEWKDNITLFTKSIERYPTYIAYANRGAAYFEAKEYSLALEDEFKALDAGFSYDAIAHILIAFIYRETGKHEEALKEVNIGLDSASYDDAKNAYSLRADIYRSLSEHDKAVEDLRHLYDYYENTNYIFWETAAIYEEAGKYHLSVLEIEKLLELEPHNAEAKRHRTKLLNKIADGDYPIPEDAA
ncbi:MAG: tetratricopeptide repeat protein [Endomicrobia bacterium]|nr:tetratricopeptide repeat protein [Endomicrobiia bacterium]